MFLTLLGFYRVPRYSYTDCKICMMTSDYLKQLFEHKDAEESKINDEVQKLCEMFDRNYQAQCRNIVDSELPRLNQYNPVRNTSQQFCYSIGYCKKSGPGRKHINIKNHYKGIIDNVVKSTKEIVQTIFDAFEEI